MLKRKYVKRMYVKVAYCDKCGAPMEHTGMVYASYPAQYPYVCSNKECDGQAMFWESDRPGKLCYEFENEEVEDV